MKAIVSMLINIIHFLTFGWLVIAGILGLIYEIIGYAKFEQLLAVFGITKGVEHIWRISIIMLLLLIVTHFIKVKLLA